MLCALCRKHNESSKKMVWLTIPCKFFRKDKLREHERSQCHADAVKAEAMAIAARHSGGIRAYVEEQVCLQRQAVCIAHQVSPPYISIIYIIILI